MPHWVPVALALAVLAFAAAVAMWALAERDGRQLRRHNASLEARNARQALRIRHYRAQANRLRADLTRCVATAALTPDACTDPLEALYALPAYTPEERS